MVLKSNSKTALTVLPTSWWEHLSIHTDLFYHCKQFNGYGPLPSYVIGSTYASIALII